MTAMLSLSSKKPGGFEIGKANFIPWVPMERVFAEKRVGWPAVNTYLHWYFKDNDKDSKFNPQDWVFSFSLLLSF